MIQLAELREAIDKQHELEIQEFRQLQDDREKIWFNALAEKSGVDTS